MQTHFPIPILTGDDLLDKTYYKRLVAHGKGTLPAEGKQTKYSSSSNAYRRHKVSARNLVVDLFSPIHFPGKLDIVTLPGGIWEFERRLLDARSGEKTHIMGCEMDTDIFDQSLFFMPREKGEALDLHCEWEGRGDEQIDFAASNLISGYLLSTVQNLIRDFIPVCEDVSFNAAYLDFCSPPTESLMNSIWSFINNFPVQRLAVTFMEARYTNNFKAYAGLVRRNGKYDFQSWIINEFGRRKWKLADCRPYYNGYPSTPMIQMVFDKKGCKFE